MARARRLGWLLVFLGGAATLTGCELIVDFDRSKIGGDSTPDTPETDGGTGPGPDAGESPTDDDDGGTVDDEDAGA